MSEYIEVSGIVTGARISPERARALEEQFRVWLDLRGLSFQGRFTYENPPPPPPGAVMMAEPGAGAGREP